MGPIVIYILSVNIIGSEFKLDQQELNELVHPGHKGLIMLLNSEIKKIC